MSATLPHFFRTCKPPRPTPLALAFRTSALSAPAFGPGLQATEAPAGSGRQVSWLDSCCRPSWPGLPEGDDFP